MKNLRRGRRSCRLAQTPCALIILNAVMVLFNFPSSSPGNAVFSFHFASTTVFGTGRRNSNNYAQRDLTTDYLNRILIQQRQKGRRRSTATSLMSSKNEDEDDEDWRDFRAKLIMQSQQQEQTQPQILEEDDEYSDFDRPIGDPELTAAAASTTTASAVTTTTGDKTTAASSSAWAYDSGKVIEQGSIILSRAEQDFGFGLRQQYFHKCVILVLHHVENEFTKGIILNRPTNLILTDDDFVNEDGSPLEDTNDDNQWRMWFGGDVAGMGSMENPETICLHSLTSKTADEVSENVIKDIKWTTLPGARKLVSSGEAKPTDFWIFCGYAGWGPGQLMGELERESWYMAATDSNTLLKSLAKQDADSSDPRNAGLDIWQNLMDMIGHGSEDGKKNSPQAEFDDLMLREWSRENLLFPEGGSLGDEKGDVIKKEEDSKAVADSDSLPEGLEGDLIDNMIKRATYAAKNVDIDVGTLVCASSSSRYPFLLSDQEFHKSIVLIIQDNDMMSVGVILNLPMAASGNSLPSNIPCRYGGAYGIKGQVGKPSFWLHYSKTLRDAKIGSPVGDQNDDAIWSCTEEQVESAIRAGLATSQDFMVVSGFSVWGKVGKGVAGGIRGEVWDGNFDVIPKSNVRQVWDALTKQEDLSTDNVEKNLQIAETAWALSVPKENEKNNGNLASKDKKEDEDAERVVFNSNVSVKDLADDALKCWVGALLLDNPALRKTN
mmetsp:Transcript_13801/g.18889  ORF Transcript_13801/g.18889 Transcript_13801/m.18889 type:complete len:720 (-) Transcript_13801:156-2315(-)|eukprot:CAMPEP_0185728116 /NCGR_PEP_ID=MMETSP1171-20130828/3587_1 /TAXON_ID=374046 /ORGANISM="Helicotheca tamensis, Strain CCMP826" /LENGTH=719 /DNA_ID=CAMNT_0028396789 /DNA_START=133 /DNA_END=2295 /DNA_ORIENTATION=-